MLNTRRQIAALAIVTALLTACSTVKIPNIDVPGIPEFREAAAKLVDGYPEVSQAPARPKDLRSPKAWDEAARTLMSERNGFFVPEKGNMPEAPAAIEADIEALKAQVRSYKLDDPQ